MKVITVSSVLRGHTRSVERTAVNVTKFEVQPALDGVLREESTSIYIGADSLGKLVYLNLNIDEIKALHCKLGERMHALESNRRQAVVSSPVTEVAA